MIGHFFVAPERVDEDAVAWLDGDDTHHLATVLRARAGARVSVADGSGRVWAGRFAGVADGAARIELESVEHVPPPMPSITVVHALPKQRKLDDVIQRLTEVGVDRVVPVHSERSQVVLDDRKADKAVARWRAVALAAAKQSRRARQMEVSPVGTWRDAFARVGPGVVCWEEADVGLRAALQTLAAPDHLVVGIGPEGGLTADEVAGTGLPVGSLGRTVLRTETAALVAVAAIRYHFGLMEPGA